MIKIQLTLLILSTVCWLGAQEYIEISIPKGEDTEITYIPIDRDNSFKRLPSVYSTRKGEADKIGDEIPIGICARGKVTANENDRIIDLEISLVTKIEWQKVNGTEIPNIRN